MYSKIINIIILGSTLFSVDSLATPTHDLEKEKNNNSLSNPSRNLRARLTEHIVTNARGLGLAFSKASSHVRDPKREALTLLGSAALLHLSDYIVFDNGESPSSSSSGYSHNTKPKRANFLQLPSLQAHELCARVAATKLQGQKPAIPRNPQKGGVIFQRPKLWIEQDKSVIATTLSSSSSRYSPGTSLGKSVSSGPASSLPYPRSSQGLLSTLYSSSPSSTTSSTMRKSADPLAKRHAYQGSSFATSCRGRNEVHTSKHGNEHVVSNQRPFSTVSHSGDPSESSKILQPANVPQRLRNLVDRWQLEGLTPLNDMSVNWVFAAVRKNTGDKVILKIGTTPEETHREVLAMRAFGGRGCVQVEEFDAEHGAFLRRCVEPGTSLASFFPDRETASIQHALTIMRDLHASFLHDVSSFPSLKDWVASMEEGRGTLPASHYHKAQQLAHSLLRSQSRQTLLHGDLHHDNILSDGESGFIAIDPKGVIGEPAFEVSRFILNPLDKILKNPGVASLLKERIMIFSREMGVPPERVKDWTYVLSILSGAWAGSNNHLLKVFIQLAEILDDL